MPAFTVVENFDWIYMVLQVDVNLKLPAVATPKIKKSERIIYEKAPEIKHMFREPEKRPPRIVSTIFIFLCIFPLFIVLILVCCNHRIFKLFC